MKKHMKHHLTGGGTEVTGPDDAGDDLKLIDFGLSKFWEPSHAVFEHGVARGRRETRQTGGTSMAGPPFLKGFALGGHVWVIWGVSWYFLFVCMCYCVRLFSRVQRVCFFRFA